MRPPPRPQQRRPLSRPPAGGRRRSTPKNSVATRSCVGHRCSMDVIRAASGDASSIAEVWLRSRKVSVPDVPPAVHSDEVVRAFFERVVLRSKETWIAVDDGVVGLLTEPSVKLTSTRVTAPWMATRRSYWLTPLPDPASSARQRHRRSAGSPMPTALPRIYACPRSSSLPVGSLTRTASVAASTAA